jgi:hypothetical protein
MAVNFGLDVLEESFITVYNIEFKHPVALL